LVSFYLNQSRNNAATFAGGNDDIDSQGDTGTDGDADASSDTDSSSDTGASSDAIPVATVTSSAARTVQVRIPNHEIREVFRRWLHAHVAKCLKEQGNTARSVALFNEMVHGSMSSFAKEFRKLIWQTMPSQFIGSKEFVYQAYVCAFFTAAGEAATSKDMDWELTVERCAGIGRLDIILQRMGDKAAVLQEHKRELLSAKDRNGDSQSKRLTKMAEDALLQLETRQYRAAMKDHVTELREYGLGFLGPFCAVAGRFLKRRPGGQWIIKDTYSAEKDERRRARLYGAG
jgi:hypothetical protein